MAPRRRRTWIWIIAAVAAIAVVTVVAVAGAGVYLVSKRVQAEHAVAPQALRAFEQITDRFPQGRPLFEVDSAHEPRLRMPFGDIPSGTLRSTNLWVQAWDPERERLVKLSLPLWILRYGNRRVHVLRDEGGLPLRDLQLDGDELARIGPAIVLDYRRPDGLRVLLWTQ